MSFFTTQKEPVQSLFHTVSQMSPTSGEPHSPIAIINSLAPCIVNPSISSPHSWHQINYYQNELVLLKS
jgi:hypothetical protein